MKKHIYQEGIDWESEGYFIDTRLSSDVPSSADPDANLWRLWLDVFEQAKRGRFTQVPKLLPAYRQGRRSWLLGEACLYLLGDAGGPDCLQAVIQEMQNCSSYTKIQLCIPLAGWGSLSIVPLLASVFEAHSEVEDADLIPEQLSLLLEEDHTLKDASQTESAARYRELVMARYSELKQQFGTDQVPVLSGEPFSLESLARRMLRQISAGRRLDPELRHKFEAMTGIDCSDFYKSGFQPLTTAAILEDFLASPQRAKYQEGVRYFFGHRLSG
ncbi:hypothetical protein [Archangium sp.]|uniref:hypothetical protein n=1 Tax=Archangium sp. TaxID=1872627 RepID=UPI002D399A19|nr:hypothetical protein [Archangium sp.]HYO52227.1 hypothetical protein [Archangium sp.]